MEQVLLAVGDGTGSGIGPSFSHVLGIGSSTGNRDHGGEDLHFSLGFAPMCSVPFKSKLVGRTQHGCPDLVTSVFNKVRIGVFRQSFQMEHVAVGGGTVFYIGFSIFLAVGGGSGSGSCGHGGEDCRYSIHFWSFQRLALVLGDGSDAKLAFLQIFAQNSPDLARQGSSIFSIQMETSLGSSVSSTFGMLWVLPILCWSIS